MPAFFGVFIVLKNISMLKEELYFLIAIFAALFYSMLISWIALAVDIGQIVGSLRGIMLFFYAYFFVHIYNCIYKEDYFDCILVHILYAVIINCMIIIVLFLVPNLKPIWYDIVLLSETQQGQAMRNDLFVRLPGLVHSGFGALSVVNAIGFVILLYLHLYSPSKTISLSKFNLISAVLFASTVLVGRLGLVIMIMSIGLFFLSIRSKQLLLKYFKMLSIFTLILTLLGIAFYINFEERFTYGFLTIFDLFTVGKLDNSSSTVLSERFSADLSFKDFLIGTGDWSLETIDADSGFIRLITGGGLLGFTITYFFMIVPILFVKIKGLPYGLLVLLTNFLIIVIVINIKNVFYFEYNDIFQIYILIVLSIFKLNWGKPSSSINIDTVHTKLDS